MVRFVASSMIACVAIVLSSLSPGCAPAEPTPVASTTQDKITGATVVAFNVDAPDNLKVIDSDLFFTSVLREEGISIGQIWKKALPTGERKLVAQLHGLAIAETYDAESIFVVDSSFPAVLERVNLATGASEHALKLYEHLDPHIDHTEPGIRTLATKDAFVYVGATGGGVLRVDRETNAVKVMTNNYAPTAAELYPLAMGAGSDRLFWLGSEQRTPTASNMEIALYSMPLDGHSPPERIADYVNYDFRFLSLAVDGDRAFVSLGDGIWVADSKAKTFTKLVDETSEWLAVDAEGLWFVGFHDDVMLVPTSKLASKDVVQATKVVDTEMKFEDVRSIVSTSNRVFFASEKFGDAEGTATDPLGVITVVNR